MATDSLHTAQNVMSSTNVTNVRLTNLQNTRNVDHEACGSMNPMLPRITRRQTDGAYVVRAVLSLLWTQYMAQKARATL